MTVFVLQHRLCAPRRTPAQPSVQQRRDAAGKAVSKTPSMLPPPGTTGDLQQQLEIAHLERFVHTATASIENFIKELVLF